MKFKDFVGNLAKLSGLPEDHTGLKAILGDASISDKDIPDEVANTITGNVLTMESAKQNPVLKKHFTTLALNGIDDKVNTTMDELELADDVKASIKSVTNSYEKVGLLTKKVKELEAAKIAATKGDKDKLGEQIAKLNGDIKAIKDTHEAAVKDLNTKHLTDRVNWQVNSIYEGFDYALPLEKKLSVLTAKTFVSEALKGKNLTIATDDNGNLSLKTSEGTDFFDNNVKVEVPGFIKKTLLNAKAIKVSEPQQQQKKQPQHQSNGGGAAEGNAAHVTASALASDAMKDLE